MFRTFLNRMKPYFFGERDLYNVFNYTKTLTFNHFYHLYNRSHLAKRIIDIFPISIWSHPPKITDNDEQLDTDFNSNFKRFADRIELWSIFNRADKMGLIGRFSIIIIGDGKPLNSNLKIRSLDDILYVLPFSESNCTINSFIQDPQNPNYGEVEYYTITTINSEIVHYSRVIHLAEDTLENSVYSIPRLAPIYNLLIDLEKVLGSSAETFFLNSSGLVLESENINSDNAEAMKQTAEAYTNQLSKVLLAEGLNVKTLNFSIHSPKDLVNCIIDIIAGTTSIPQRILMGSERSEVASNQDDSTLDARLAERQAGFCTKIINKFLYKIVRAGGIKDIDYFVIWDDDNQLSESEQADIALRKTSAMSQYLSSGSELLIPPKQFVEGLLNMSYLEDEILKYTQEENSTINKSLTDIDDNTTNS